MLFPIGDDDRALSGRALVTLVLVVANIAVFALQLADPAITYAWSVIPAEITTGRDLVNARPLPTDDPAAEVRTPADIPQRPGPTVIYLTVLSAMFMHGGWGHLGGNLLYLWIFGDNVEQRFGAGPFALFYLGSGIAATLVQVGLDPAGIVPNLGASGAISGVLGAYLVLFPRNRVHVIVLFVVVSLPAFLVLGLWIVTQSLSGFGAVAATEETGGIAYGAHIGGFVAGAVLGLVARLRGVREHPGALSEAIARDPHTR